MYDYENVSDPSLGYCTIDLSNYPASCYSRTYDLYFSGLVSIQVPLSDSFGFAGAAGAKPAVSCGVGEVAAVAATSPTPHMMCAPRSGARGSE